MLKLVTYNIQSGIGTSSARRYFTEGWKQLLPHPQQQNLLKSIAQVVALPGRIPGRGALVVDLAGESSVLTVAVAHLALGRRDRLSQMDFLSDVLGDSEQAVLMGDMNCSASSPEFELLNRRCGLVPAGEESSRTFPSWRPVRAIDHILVSPQIGVERCEVLQHTYSDHRSGRLTDSPFSLVDSDHNHRSAFLEW